MPDYEVIIKEVWERKVRITADTSEDAETAARDGSYEESAFPELTYQYLLPDEITIRELGPEILPEGRYSAAQITQWGGILIREEHRFGKCPTYRVFTPNGLLMLYQMRDGTFSTWDEKADELRGTWEPSSSSDKYWYTVNLGPERKEALHV